MTLSTYSRGCATTTTLQQMNVGPSSVATPHQIAAFLGVSDNQVYMWQKRRERNGFPEPVGCVIAHPGVYKGSGRKRGPIFDINEVVAWYANYVPSTGGAPRGAANPLSSENRRKRKKRQAEESGLSIHS